MQEKQFEHYLIDDKSIKSKINAVASRMSKARAIESALNQNLDVIVQDDMQMYRALVAIKQNMNDSSGTYSNALRKYYIFKNGHSFPQVNAFERNHEL